MGWDLKANNRIPVIAAVATAAAAPAAHVNMAQKMIIIYMRSI